MEENETIWVELREKEDEIDQLLASSEGSQRRCHMKLMKMVLQGVEMIKKT